MIAPGWLLISLLALMNAGPDDGHIRWKFSSVKISRSESKLVFSATLDKGWHLYSQNVGDGGPMPTTFEFEKNDNVKLLGKVKEVGLAKTVFDSTFVMNVVCYENEVVFTQRVKAMSDVSVKGSINYSVCSEERCIPGTVRFDIDVTRRPL